jgi:hypothetical protein
MLLGTGAGRVAGARQGEIITFDPEHNLLLGCQMYSNERPTDSVFSLIVQSGLPLLIGACTFRDPNNCSIGWYGAPLDQYQKVWEQCYKNGIGCFYWCWYASCDKLSVDGKYGNWTEAGNYICGTGEFSLSKTSKKSRYLLSGNCGTPVALPFPAARFSALPRGASGPRAAPLFTLDGRKAGPGRLPQPNGSAGAKTAVFVPAGPGPDSRGAAVLVGKRGCAGK